jgi:hypothetical protein
MLYDAEISLLAIYIHLSWTPTQVSMKYVRDVCHSIARISGVLEAIWVPILKRMGKSTKCSLWWNS